MVYPEVERLLQNAIGLDANSIGSSAIERAIRERSAACNLPDLNAYSEHVSRSQPELQELIEAVVVPETWFFRDRQAFPALVRIAREFRLDADPDSVFRMLSLPCSTGEEPYSAAMALLDAGFPPESFQIDAVDISARAIARAEQGIYGKNSFRTGELEFRDRHFDTSNGAYQLSASVRGQVCFQRGNLLHGGWQPRVPEYDAVFCRNLLIYFDRATQDRALHVLSRILKSTGFLFVGPSEAGVLLGHGFASAGLPRSFAFRKIGGDAVMARPRRSHRIPVSVAVASRPAEGARRASTRRPFALAPAAAPTIAAPASEPGARLDAATGLANQGRMTEAEECCREEIREHGHSAQAFYLLGLIHSAGGDLGQAVQHYRNALFLDRHHHEALIHLALLLEQQGDAAAAQLLRTRAKRSESESNRTHE